MKWYAPEGYTAFRCKAGACRHTCCAGWEICIDRESLARYLRVEGAFGERLCAAIEGSGEDAHFRLVEGERCALLRPDGLCELYDRLGEESLCQVCTDHPRFRSFFAGRTEVGLGLCCEAAAEQLILQPGPWRLTLLDDDGAADENLPEEEELLAVREQLTETVQADVPWRERVSRITEAYGLRALPDTDEMTDLLLRLERLDAAWTELLLRPERPEAAAQHDLVAGRLAAYFLFRHLPGALDDGRWEARTRFALWAADFICCLSARRGDGLPLLADTARMFSGEIEYSDENMEALLDRLDKE